MSEALAALMPLVVLMLPLCLAAGLAFAATRAIALRLAPWAALPALVQATFATPDVALHLPWLLLGAELGVTDDTARTFLLFTALLWWLAGMYARVYLREDPGRSRFFVYFLLSLVGNIGVILAQDMATFYLFFAVMSFASYGLVAHERSSEALRAGRVYIVFVLIGEVMLFAAVVLATSVAGATGFDAVRHGLVESPSRELIILLVFGGFGIKAGVLGLHTWLPLAHPVAPTPASAVLSGSMIKAGLLGWLRMLPLGEAALPGWGEAFLVLGLGAAFYGVAVGLTQRDPKTLLAYSSVSQMGLMTVAVGLGLLTPQAWPAMLPVVLFYALHHALSKGALFMGVSLKGGRTQRAWWNWLGMWLPALALAGAPWTSGMYAKLLLNGQAVQAPVPWDALLPLLLSLSAFASSLLMARLLYLVRPAVQSASPPMSGLARPWLAALLAVALVPLALLPPMPAPEAGQVVASLWPALVAGLLTMIVLRTGWFRSVRELPAGDVLVVIERALRVTRTGIARLQGKPLRLLQRGCNALRLRAATRLGRAVDSLPVLFPGEHWSTAIMVFVLLALALAWLAV